MARALPRGTVTFLFTDIEGSTRLLRRLGEGYGDVLAEHGGSCGKPSTSTTAGSWTRRATRSSPSFRVPETGWRRRSVRSEHSPSTRGLAARRCASAWAYTAAHGEERYVGMGVHKAARIGSAAHGGQILLSRATRELVADDLPPRVRIVDLGEHRLKDFDQSEQIFQLDAPRLPHRFPPLRTDAPLPQARWPRTSRITRERALIAVAAVLIIAAIVVGIGVAMSRHETSEAGGGTTGKSAGPFTAPGDDPSEIRIGRSIGGVELGMSEAEVQRRYGEGIQSQWLRRGRGGDRILYPGDRGSLTVSFYSGKVAQVTTSSPYYSTDNGVHVGVSAPDLDTLERDLGRHQVQEIAPGVYAWKNFIFDSTDRSYCLRDDRSATQLAFGGGVSRHITVVAITDSRLLEYLPVTVVEGAGIVSDHFCSADPLEP